MGEFVPFLTEDEVRKYVPEGTKSVCLMASYDHGNRIHPNLLEYLKQLSPHFDRLVLITNTRDLHNDGVPSNCGILMVANGGRDFGMWSRVLGNLPPEGLERIALVNDSCYIVNRNLAKEFARAKDNGYGFWGLVKSEEIQPHIQSFFVVAEKPAVVDVLEFFRLHPVKYNAERDEVIHTGEIGLSAYMAEKGHELCGLYDMSSVLRVAPPRLLPPNPSVFYCDVLLVIGYPLLKKKAMFMNPLATGVVEPYFLRTL